jgi:hypothetical protein
VKLMMQGSTAVAANSSEKNVLDGELYQTLPYDSVMALYITGSAAGLEAQMFVGGQAVSNSVTVNAENRVPLVPDDQLISGFIGYNGQPLMLKVTNTTGGALTSYWKVELQSAQLRRQG